MSDGYSNRRRNYTNISGSLSITTATDDTTLVACRTNYTIYIQEYFVQVTGASATTWSLEDSAGTPVTISGALSVSTAPADYHRDFGAEGLPLSAGKDFVLNVAATGAKGQLSWVGYMKLNTTVNLTTATNAI